jgi:hypothetical protein
MLTNNEDSMMKTKMSFHTVLDLKLNVSLTPETDKIIVDVLLLLSWRMVMKTPRRLRWPEL